MTTVGNAMSATLHVLARKEHESSCRPLSTQRADNGDRRSVEITPPAE
jgi:hypothetical protein